MYNVTHLFYNIKRVYTETKVSLPSDICKCWWKYRYFIIMKLKELSASTATIRQLNKHLSILSLVSNISYAWKLSIWYKLPSRNFHFQTCEFFRQRVDSNRCRWAFWHTGSTGTYRKYRNIPEVQEHSNLLTPTIDDYFMSYVNFHHITISEEKCHAYLIKLWIVSSFLILQLFRRWE